MSCDEDEDLSLTFNFAFGSLVMKCQVSRDVIFNMGAFNINISDHFKWETFLSFAIHWNSSLSFPQAYLPIWQIKVLHTHSIIRLIRLSFSFIWNADGVTKFSFVFFFVFFFMVITFQLKPWIGLSLDSHQLTVEETGLFQQSKNIKAYIRQYCKVLWLLFT